MNEKTVDEYMNSEPSKQEVMTLNFLYENLLVQIEQNTIRDDGEPKGCANGTLHYFLCRGHEYIENKLNEIEKEEV